MTHDAALREGQILTGPLFSEPMRVDCYWLYVATRRDSELMLQEPANDPDGFDQHEVKKVDHYWLGIDGLTHSMRLREGESEP